MADREDPEAREPADDLLGALRGREFASQPRLPLRFFLDVGRFDVYYDNALNMNRHMRDVLIATGYPLEYEEYNGGHDGIPMRGSIATGLVALAGSWRR